MSKLSRVISTACDALRGEYAKDVILGYQRWSGADLKGKASKYGVHYANQRRKAASALKVAGGAVIPTRNGRLVTAVRVGQDDWGNALYETTEGAFVATAGNCKQVTA